MYDMHELRSKNRQELLSLISELKGKLLALRFETATGQLTETHLIKNTKQDIAKIFTVLKEQEQGIVIKEKPLPEKTKRRFGRKSVEAEKIVEAPLPDLKNEEATIDNKIVEENLLENKEEIKQEDSLVEKITDDKKEEGNS